GEHVHLRSATLGREVIPRLTNAHDSKFGPAVYRFLSALQYQGAAAELTWTWGVLAHAPFLPRVVCGRLILSPARWFVTAEELRELDHDSPASRFKAIQAWRVRRHIPSVIFLSDGDNSLPLDLENPLSAESFAMLLRRRDSAVLVESFAGHGSITHAPEPGYLHHLVVPFIKSRREVKRVPQVGRESEKKANGRLSRRTFSPGSEYIYAKLYTGTETADRVLQNMLRPLVRIATKRGLIDRWFFVRYGDPEWHLRLRFHGKRRQLNSKFLPLLQAGVEKLIRRKLVWRFQLDTYEREVERYGGVKAIVLAEKLFHADSEMVLTIIEKLGRTEDEGSMRRWQLALYGTDRLLIDFGFDLNARAHFVKRARDAYATEHVVDKKFDRQLSEKFRGERQIVSHLLEADSHRDPYLKLVRRRSQAMSRIVRKLQLSAEEGSLTVSLEEFVLSCIHMNLNRLLISAHREHELVIYDFLMRLYESRIARARSK
ncbi:MAG TPA: thiopeptide-type bacteriocin biosynthesis protein, partial [Pyrinomonadaceae bacterium]|nr:thiopeptide-type bacteriocin biosynthesis protein [Pyrinomonadaceae bacterium]